MDLEDYVSELCTNFICSGKLLGDSCTYLQPKVVELLHVINHQEQLQKVMNMLTVPNTVQVLTYLCDFRTMLTAIQYGRGQALVYMLMSGSANIIYVACGIDVDPRAM